MIRSIFSGTSEAFDRGKGRGLWEVDERREEDGGRAGKKVPSEEAVGGEGSAGKSCPENYPLRGGVEAINSYI